MLDRIQPYPVVVVEADGLEAIRVLQHLEDVGRHKGGELRAQVDVLDGWMDNDGDGLPFTVWKVLAAG